MFDIPSFVLGVLAGGTGLYGWYWYSEVRARRSRLPDSWRAKER